jgi:hypothetical protein
MDHTTWFLLVWLFPLATTIHNVEEGILLPSWSQKAGKWHAPVKKGEFHFAVIVLTIFAYVTTTLGQDTSSLWFYINLGYILSMLINVFLPHLIGTLYLKQYIPGLITALLFNLPINSWLLWQACYLEGFQLDKFAIIAPITVIAIVWSIPFLFYIGRKTLRY